MRNRNTLITATLCALAIALVPVADAPPFRAAARWWPYPATH